MTTFYSKKILLALALFMAFSCTLIAQQTITKSIMHGGMERTYIMYIPALYDGSEAVPVVLNYHGYTSSAAAQMNYGDFRPIADTAGFIVVHPEGTLLNGSSHWNVGGWTIGSTVDDVDFTSVMLDAIAAEYNIDNARIYSTGMSNGGFMSFLLACQLSDRIAAIASVTGSMTPETYADCQPNHVTPVMQIHGVDDSVVPYSGAIWTRSIADVMDYWSTYNNCQMSPSSTSIPDTNPTDGSTVEHEVYDQCDQMTTTEHFKIAGGDHTWPGTAFNSAGTNYDIDASYEIWEFFRQHDLSSLTDLTEGTELNGFDIILNSEDKFLSVEGLSQSYDFGIYSLTGIQLVNGTINQYENSIDLSSVTSGMYFIKIGDVTERFFLN